MKPTIWRILPLLALILGTLAGNTPGHAAEPGSNPIKLDIPAQPIDDALREFGKQSGLNVFLDTAEGRGVLTTAVVGTFTVADALTKLLGNTGLHHEYIDDRTVAIRGPGPSEPDGGKTSSLVAPPSDALRLSQSEAAEPAVADASGPPGIISGNVKDGAAGAPLAGARVRILETGETTQTDDLGRFRFRPMRPGEYTLSVSYIGYAEKLWRVAVGGPSSSQDYVLEQSAWDLAEVTVFGTRSARAKALNAQRMAENSSSVISADLLGNFTDTTISEALRRAPGIAFQRDDITGKGVNVIVRGMAPDYNAIKLNGLNLPIGDGTQRAPGLANMLADSVEKITINTTLLPSHDSSGTGGLIEIETKSPLSRPHRFASVSVENGRRGRSFADELLASATVSGTFGAERNFGLSLAAQYQDVEQQTFGYGVGLSTGQYLPLDRNGSTETIYSPEQVDPRVLFPFEPGASTVYGSSTNTNLTNIDRSNLSLTLSGEWQPAAHTNLRLDMQRLEGRQRFLNRTTSFSAADSTGYVVRPVAALGDEVRQALQWGGKVFERQDYNFGRNARDITETFSLNGSTKLGAWEHGYVLGYAHGATRSPDGFVLGFGLDGGNSRELGPAAILPQATDSVENVILSIFGPRTGKGFPVPLLTQAGWAEVNDSGNHYFTGASANDSIRGWNDRYTLNLDTRYDVGRAHLRNIEAGVNLELSEAASPGGATTTVNVPLDPDTFEPIYPSMSQLGLELADSNLSAIGVPGPSFSILSRQALQGFVDAIPRLAGGPGAPFQMTTYPGDPRASQQLLTEDNIAAYLQSRIDFGRLSFVGGARMTRVDVEAVELTSPIVFDRDFNYDAEFAAEFAKVFSQSARSVDVLPRVQVNFRMSDDLIFRGGYFLTVARPDIVQLSDQQQIMLFLGGVRPSLTVNQGNPGLKPSVTDNFDLSAEYYDDQIGLLKLSAFYKHLKNLLQYNRTIGASVLDGVILPDHPYFNDLPENIEISSSLPVNSDETAHIWGIEAAVEKQFGFLPGIWSGLGFYGNYTYTRSSGPQHYDWGYSPVYGPDGALEGYETRAITLESLPFEYQPRHSGTAALTYSRNRIDATLAYSMQARYLSAYFPNGLMLYEEQAKTLDLRTEYRMDTAYGDYRIYFEASDLLKGARDPDVERSRGGEDGVPRYFTSGNYFGGRMLRLGIAATF